MPEATGRWFHHNVEYYEAQVPEVEGARNIWQCIKYDDLAGVCFSAL